MFEAIITIISHAKNFLNPIFRAITETNSFSYLFNFLTEILNHIFRFFNNENTFSLNYNDWLNIVSDFFLVLIIFLIFFIVYRIIKLVINAFSGFVK